MSTALDRDARTAHLQAGEASEESQPQTGNSDWVGRKNLDKASADFRDALSLHKHPPATMISTRPTCARDLGPIGNHNN
jgi:hypothetical protein